MQTLQPAYRPNQHQDAAGEGGDGEMPAPEMASPLPLRKNGEKRRLKSPLISRGTEKRGKVVAQTPPSASVSSAPSTGGTDKTSTTWMW